MKSIFEFLNFGLSGLAAKTSEMLCEASLFVVLLATLVVLFRALSPVKRTRSSPLYSGPLLEHSASSKMDSFLHKNDIHHRRHLFKVLEGPVFRQKFNQKLDSMRNDALERLKVLSKSSVTIT